MAEERDLDASKVSQTSLTRIFSEGAALASVTATIYAMVGAYQLGFQRELGFTYLVLGVEDVVTVTRIFILPLIYAGFSSLIFTVGILPILPKRWIRHPIRYFCLTIFRFSPIFFLIHTYFNYFHGNSMPEHNTSVYGLVIIFYILDPFVWSLVARMLRDDSIHIPEGGFRIAQAVTAAFLLICAAYAVGSVDAHNITEAERCPDVRGRASILVQRYEDLSICEEVDLQHHKIFQRVFFFRIPEDGKARTFQYIRFNMPLAVVKTASI